MAVKERKKQEVDDLFRTFLDEVCNPRSCCYWEECGGIDPRYCTLWEDFKRRDRRSSLTLTEQTILLRWEQGENTRDLGIEFQCSAKTVGRRIKKALQILTSHY